jgi:plastocyanin
VKKLVPLSLAVAVALAPALTSCSSHAQAQTQTKKVPPVVVTIKNMAFNPAKITIHKGQTVKWKWDDGGMPHDVSGDGTVAKLLASGLRTSGTYTATFDTAGTFTYHCTPHPTMTGTVVVKD